MVFSIDQIYTVVDKPYTIKTPERLVAQMRKTKH